MSFQFSSVVLLAFASMVSTLPTLTFTSFTYEPRKTALPDVQGEIMFHLTASWIGTAAELSPFCVNGNLDVSQFFDLKLRIPLSVDDQIVMEVPGSTIPCQILGNHYLTADGFYRPYRHFGGSDFTAQLKARARSFLHPGIDLQLEVGSDLRGAPGVNLPPILYMQNGLSYSITGSTMLLSASTKCNFTTGSDSALELDSDACLLKVKDLTKIVNPKVVQITISEYQSKTSTDVLSTSTFLFTVQAADDQCSPPELTDGAISVIRSRKLEPGQTIYHNIEKMGQSKCVGDPFINWLDRLAVPGIKYNSASSVISLPPLPGMDLVPQASSTPNERNYLLQWETGNQTAASHNVVCLLAEGHESKCQAYACFQLNLYFSKEAGSICRTDVSCFGDEFCVAAPPTTDKVTRQTTTQLNVMTAQSSADQTTTSVNSQAATTATYTPTLTMVGNLTATATGSPTTTMTGTLTATATAGTPTTTGSLTTTMTEVCPAHNIEVSLKPGETAAKINFPDIELMAPAGETRLVTKLSDGTSCNTTVNVIAAGVVCPSTVSAEILTGAMTISVTWKLPSMSGVKDDEIECVSCPSVPQELPAGVHKIDYEYKYKPSQAAIGCSFEVLVAARVEECTSEAETCTSGLSKGKENAVFSFKTADGKTTPIEFPVGTNSLEIVSEAGLNCTKTIKVLDTTPVRSSVNLVVKYAVDCDSLNPFSWAVINSTLLHHYTNLIYACNDCGLRKTVDPDITCKSGVLSVAWPADITFPQEKTDIDPWPATRVDLVSKLMKVQEDHVTLTGRYFVITVIMQNPPVAHPTKGLEDLYVYPEAVSSCPIEALVYDEEDDACYNNVERKS